jgi:LacI family transcriptional regulator
MKSVAEIILALVAVCQQATRKNQGNARNVGSKILTSLSEGMYNEGMSKTVTIHDIAREAGVSSSTVSRVLSGNVPVASHKRDAVLAVVKKLNYRPNAIAQGLARGRTAAIGVMTQSISSPFYGEILRGIEQGLAGSGYHPVVASGNWRTQEELAALDLLSSRRVDGLIVLPGIISDDRLRHVAEELPLMVIGRTIAGIERQCLRVDDALAAHEATRYLIDLGHRRIAHIAGPATHQDAVDRREGYTRALGEAGLPLDDQLLVAGDYTEQSGLLALQSLLSRGVLFTAIFAANDQMAYGARLGLYRRGIRVPEDVSIVGFDDLLSSAYTTPPLTTVRQPTFDMGRAAAQALLQLLAEHPVHLPTFTTSLVIRESAALRR